MDFQALDPKSHDRKSFDCGVATLNGYLQRFAGQDMARGLTRVYVLAEGAEIIGYYSLSAHAVARDALPEAVQVGAYAELPFLLLGRLAVAKKWQGQGYGDALIVHAFQTTRTTAKAIGILGMIVDAKDENAARFYEGFGFARLAGAANRLVLPITAMDRLLDR
jgi:GNAT superfamily N-acetyltransferase